MQVQVQTGIYKSHRGSYMPVQRLQLFLWKGIEHSAHLWLIIKQWACMYEVIGYLVTSILIMKPCTKMFCNEVLLYVLPFR